MENLTEIKKAKEYFEKGCNGYLWFFCEKHDFDFEEAKNSWVANEVGGVVCVGDYFIGMETIITDIEMDAPENEFSDWYYYNIDAHEFNFPTPNFKSWVLGCPRTSEETFAKLRDLKASLQEAINEEKTRLKYEIETT